ncbi:hypothetical protein [Streptomyces sp. AF1A]|uniref:hypothetical protein n=1 Tax=Streptomyces sp. AF1A TaxID=3394350 RepID=UPI0039BC6C1E
MNPVRLYPVPDAAASWLTTDPGLATLRGLRQSVREPRHIPTGAMRFLTVPRESYVHDADRDQLVEPEAGKLFERLRTDRPVAVAKNVPGQTSPENGGTAPSPPPRSAATPPPHTPVRSEHAKTANSCSGK